MTIFRHELRQGRAALILWTAAIGSLLAVCVLLFPQIRGQTEEVGRLFASMGSFTAAFGMDRLDIGTLPGFYAVECGSVLGLGGALFASLLGVSSLAKEERDRTAEFLLTHPLSRRRIVGQKLAALLAQIAAMDAALLALALASLALIGEPIPWREMLLLHGAYFLLQVELGCVCFGVSAFLRRGGAGMGMGLAAGAYFLDLIANMTERASFLKYATPFAYCDGADILSAGKLDGGLVALGMLAAAIGVAAAAWRYSGKDIR